MVNTKHVIVAAALLAAVSGCGAKNNVKNLVGLGGPDRTIYSGTVYPATSKTAIAFQPSQVNKSCRVFAESLVETPPQFTGKDVEASILAEAGKRGADLVLIGRARESKDNNGLAFHYYGPAHEYLCTDQCGGWKYGYDLWEQQGDWVSFGYAQWGKANAVYEMPMILQVAMLRCQ
jgi:hypothetical protein